MKVAVVDDSLAVQESLGKLLASEAGIDVVGFAEDVAGAISLIGSRRPDIVILDVELRHPDRGIDVLHHVRKEHPHIQIVVLSNMNWEAMRTAYLAAGASAYFDKAMEFMQAKQWILDLRTRLNSHTTRSVT